MLVPTGEGLLDAEVEDRDEDVMVDGVLEVEGSVDVGVGEAVVLSSEVVRRDDAKDDN